MNKRTKQKLNIDEWQKDIKILSAFLEENKIDEAKKHIKYIRSRNYNFYSHTISENIEKWILRLRIDDNLSYGKISKKTGISKTQVYYICNPDKLKSKINSVNNEHLSIINSVNNEHLSINPDINPDPLEK